MFIEIGGSWFKISFHDVQLENSKGARILDPSRWMMYQAFALNNVLYRRNLYNMGLAGRRVRSDA